MGRRPRAEIARLAGVDPRARYVEFVSFEPGYFSSWDLESGLHPQTILAYGMNGDRLQTGYGAPLRLYSAVKLGYKMVKYLLEVNFLPVRTGGYLEDQGMSGSPACDAPGEGEHGSWARRMRRVRRVDPGGGRAAAPAERHLQGEVVSATGNTVEMKGGDGKAERFTVTDATRVSVASKTDVQRIDKNAHVGTTAVAQPDGTLRALEVHVFPEAARGSREGHRPWDLQAGSSMTNATVAGVGGAGGGSTMTNATVAEAKSGDDGLRMTLRYKDGEKTVVVPAGTPVVQLEPADRSKLVPGARIFAAVKPAGDGAPVADRIVVGRDVAPPM